MWTAESVANGHRLGGRPDPIIMALEICIINP